MKRPTPGFAASTACLIWDYRTEPWTDRSSGSARELSVGLCHRPAVRVRRQCGGYRAVTPSRFLR